MKHVGSKYHNYHLIVILKITYLVENYSRTVLDVANERE